MAASSTSIAVLYSLVSLVAVSESLTPDNTFFRSSIATFSLLSESGIIDSDSWAT